MPPSACSIMRSASGARRRLSYSFPPMVEPPYRTEYIEALTLLAKASSAVREAGRAAPVLVGGAVVEFDTASQITSGDFDFVSTEDEPFAKALLMLGFIQGDGRSRRTMQFTHPSTGIGVELVSGHYFDGRADRERVRLVQVGDVAINMALTENLIADRMGQWIGSERPCIALPSRRAAPACRGIGRCVSRQTHPAGDGRRLRPGAADEAQR